MMLLKDTPKDVSEDRLKIDEGMVPDKLFISSEISVKLVSWPRASRILPPKLFLAA